MRNLFLIIIICVSFAFSSYPQKKVYVAQIETEIDLGLSPYISRAISEAEKAGAKAIIFKVNTFGGRVDAATQIKGRDFSKQNNDNRFYK